MGKELYITGGIVDSQPLPGVEFSVSKRKEATETLLSLADEVRDGFPKDRDRTGRTWSLLESNGQTTLEISRRFVDNSVRPPVVTIQGAIIHSPEALFFYNETVESDGRFLRPRESLANSSEAVKRISVLLKSFSSNP